MARAPWLSALPLFPTQHGVTESKAAVVQTVVAQAEQLGVPTVSEQGAQLFGGQPGSLGQRGPR